MKWQLIGVAIALLGSLVLVYGNARYDTGKSDCEANYSTQTVKSVESSVKTQNNAAKKANSLSRIAKLNYLRDRGLLVR